jgi:hypothetical protein
MFLYGKDTLFYMFSSIVYVGGVSVAYRTKFYGDGLKILALIIFACQTKLIIFSSAATEHASMSTISIKASVCCFTFWHMLLRTTTAAAACVHFNVENKLGIVN